MAINIFIFGFLLLLMTGNFLVNSSSISSILNDEKPFKNSSNESPVQLFATPNTVYVEILCFVDYPIHKLHEDNYNYTRDYYSSYWKAVDNYFQLLDKPRVRIILTDVIIYQNKTTVMNVFNILKQMGKYKYLQTITKNDNMPNHDVTVFITDWDLFEDTSDDTLNQVTGKTFASGACSIDYKQRLDKSVAMVQDDGLTYKGIRKTISLIGELLGAVEDGSPGAESCDSNDGFIMSSRNTFDAPFTFSWSNCSIKSIRKFLNEKPSSSTSNSSQIKFNNPTCLFNKPHNLKINLTSHWLPGQALSLNDYCKKLTGNYGVCYQYRVSPCTHILCRNTYGQCTDTNWGPALEGSWCHDIDRCQRGQCVPFPFADTISDDDNYNTTSIEKKISLLDII